MATATHRLIGRDGELRRLEDAVEAAAAGEPAFVLVLGEAGIGKTSLLRAAEASARGAGLRVLAGTAIESGRGFRTFRSLRRWRPHSIRKPPMTRRESCGRPSPPAVRAMAERRPQQLTSSRRASSRQCSKSSPGRPRFSASTTCTGRTSRRSQSSTTSPTVPQTRRWRWSAVPGTTSHRSSPCCLWPMGGALLNSRCGA